MFLTTGMKCLCHMTVYCHHTAFLTCHLLFYLLLPVVPPGIQPFENEVVMYYNNQYISSVYKTVWPVVDNP